jgi:hypothetical protein
VLWAGDLVPLKQPERKRPPLEDVRHCTSDIRYRMLTCGIQVVHIIVYTMSYTAIVWTYDIVCHVHTTSYIHFRHTTLYTICGDEYVRCRMCHILCRLSLAAGTVTPAVQVDLRHRSTSTPGDVTYDVARTMSYKYVYTISHVRCSTRCRLSHVRCRTCRTYDRGIRRESYVTYDIRVGGKNHRPVR